MEFVSLNLEFKNMIYKTKSENELINLGYKIAEKIKGGDIVLLYGDLGAGKTTMTKGIAKHFGIDEVVSPTFTLMQTYEVDKSASSQASKFVHIDTYRLENEEDLIEIGVEDYLGEENTICVVEWPEKIEGLLKDKKIIKITIEHSDNGRMVSMEG